MARKPCEWYLEKEIVTAARLSDEASAVLDKVVDALVKAIDAGTTEFEALKLALEKLAPTNDNVMVTLIYACERRDGSIVRRKADTDNTENVNWAPSVFETPLAKIGRRNVIRLKTPRRPCCKRGLLTVATARDKQQSRRITVKMGKPTVVRREKRAPKK